MCNKYPKGGAINLWCDGNYDLSDGGNQQKKIDAASEQSSDHKAKEDGNKCIFMNLHDKRSGKFGMQKLCLWSRMVFMITTMSHQKHKLF